MCSVGSISSGGVCVRISGDGGIPDFSFKRLLRRNIRRFYVVVVALRLSFFVSMKVVLV